MGRKYKQDDVDDREDEEEEEDETSETAHEQRGGSSPWTRVLAAIGFIAIGAIVVPALWGLVAEAPNLRRYLRIMRM